YVSVALAAGQNLPGTSCPLRRETGVSPCHFSGSAAGIALAERTSEDTNVADGIYVGMAAAAARADQLDSIADNLANAETPGYKATRPAFQSFLPPYKGPGLVDKVFATVVSTGTDMSPGAVVTTDNPLDILPGGETFLSV